VITLFHVLEHLRNPVETLRGLHGLSKENGLIIIEVPNIHSTPQTKALHIAHTFGFSPNTLELVLRAAGFTPLHKDCHVAVPHATRLIAQRI
jgi:hypothetical protein